MGKVIAAASMSLDGYIAKEDNTIGRLFDWYQNGEVEFPAATAGITFHLSPQSAEYWGQWVSGLSPRRCRGSLDADASLTPAPSERTCVWLARGQGGPERAVMRSREVSLGLRCGWQQRLHLLGEVVEARPEGAAERGGESVLGKVRPVPLHDRR